MLEHLKRPTPAFQWIPREVKGDADRHSGELSGVGRSAESRNKETKELRWFADRLVRPPLPGQGSSRRNGSSQLTASPTKGKHN